MKVDPLVGRELAGYRIEALIGRGGMSRVYRAVQHSVERPVALKLLSLEFAEDDTFRRRFLHESRLAASLEHPHILPVYDAGEAEGYLFIAMRLVEGSDLRRLLEREGPLAPERAVALIAQAASALDAAHAHGLVHRDVKPANLLLAGEHLYLADFGVAKLALSSQELTRTGMFVGTLDYASPEQIRSEPLDGRADIYSLGCVLYHCLTGRVPYERRSEYGMMQAHLTEPPPRLSRSDRSGPDALDPVIATALAKEPDRRYPTAGSLAEAARTAASGNLLMSSTPTRSNTQLPLTALSRRPAPPTQVVGSPIGSPTRHVAAPPPPSRAATGLQGWTLAAAAVVLLGAGAAGAWVVGGTRGAAPTPSLGVARPDTTAPAAARPQTPTPTLPPTLTPSPRPGIAELDVRRVLERLNLVLWPRAVSTLDGSAYDCCAAGVYLQELRKDLDRLRCLGETWRVTNHGFDYVGGLTRIGDDRVMIRTRETWSWDVIRGGVVVSRQPPTVFVQTYVLARAGDTLFIVEHRFDEPQPAPRSCP